MSAGELAQIMMKQIRVVGVLKAQSPGSRAIGLGG
jgi:hypothetical protein